MPTCPPRLLAVLLLAAACRTASVAPETRTGGVDNFCGRIIDVVAERQAECLGGEAADWATQLRSFDSCTEIRAGVAAGRIRHEPSAEAACLARLRSEPCASLPRHTLSLCDAALRGARAAGESCFSEFDCTPGSSCRGTGQGCGGVCQPETPVGSACDVQRPCGLEASCRKGLCTATAGERESCENAFCQSGLSCTVDGTGGRTCQAAATGTACASDEQCGDFMMRVCRDGACVLRPVAGESCALGKRECGRLAYCAQGRDESHPSCERFGGIGSQCGFIQGEFAGCLEGFCDAEGGKPGTCRSRLVQGEACSPAVQGRCAGRCDPDTRTCAASCAEVGR